MRKQHESAVLWRVHDYGHLIARWRSVAARAGLRMDVFAEADGYPLYVAGSARRAGRPSLYLSAGIHGDEAASTEGLLAWMTRRADAVARSGADVLVFPCLNPWGLVNNSRTDAAGKDLNRAFRRRDVPQIEAQKELIGARVFDAAVMLHEDFDACGVYIYEIPRARPFWGERILAAAARHVPAEPRPRVEGRRCRGGIVRTRVTPETLRDHPEAFYVHFGHTRRCLTIETPSEFAIERRVAAHVAMLDAVWKLVRQETANTRRRGRPAL